MRQVYNSPSNKLFSLNLVPILYTRGNSSREEKDFAAPIVAANDEQYKQLLLFIVKAPRGRFHLVEIQLHVK